MGMWDIHHLWKTWRAPLVTVKPNPLLNLTFHCPWLVFNLKPVLIPTVLLKVSSAQNPDLSMALYANADWLLQSLPLLLSPLQNPLREPSVSELHLGVIPRYGHSRLRPAWREKGNLHNLQRDGTPFPHRLLNALSELNCGVLWLN